MGVLECFEFCIELEVLNDVAFCVRVPALHTDNVFVLFLGYHNSALPKTCYSTETLLVLRAALLDDFTLFALVIGSPGCTIGVVPLGEKFRVHNSPLEILSQTT